MADMLHVFIEILLVCSLEFLIHVPLATGVVVVSKVLHIKSRGYTVEPGQ
jgi:hypothetical protein